MSCQGCLNGHLGGEIIPDFADQYDVGILPYDVPQGLFKGEVDIWID